MTQNEIDELIQRSTISAETKFEKTTIVTCQLQNGFIIVESSSCVDPVNYDFEIGYNICIDRIKNKLWELEGYCLQKSLS